MKKILIVMLTVLATLSMTTGRFVARAFADDAETTLKNNADDAKTTTKKALRKSKRKVRKATGTDSTAKDAQDKANDVGDDISNTADKTKNKLSQ